jgi:hypothetical protein
METWIERKFLKYLDRNTNPLTEQINIEDFIVGSFKRPNPLSPKTTNENDKAVNLLKTLKNKGFIEYNDDALSHVNNWCVDTEGKRKRWFDTLHEPLYVTLTDKYFTDYSSLSFLSQLLNSKLVLYIKKYAVKAGGKIWKAFLAISAILISAYLGSGNHFDDLIKLIKTIFK